MVGASDDDFGIGVSSSEEWVYFIFSGGARQPRLSNENLIVELSWAWESRGSAGFLSASTMKILMSCLFMETRRFLFELLEMWRNSGFVKKNSVDCNGSSHSREGGLGLFWKAEVDIQVVSASLNHISIPCSG